MSKLFVYLILMLAAPAVQAGEKWTCGYVEYKQVVLEKEQNKNTYSAYILTRNYMASGTPILDREDLAKGLSCSWSASEPLLFYCEIKKPGEISASLVVNAKIVSQAEMVEQASHADHMYNSRTYEVRIKKFDYDVAQGETLVLQIPVETIKSCRLE